MNKLLIIIILLIILLVILLYPIIMKKPKVRPSIESFQNNISSITDLKEARQQAHQAGYTDLHKAIPIPEHLTKPKVVVSTDVSGTELSVPTLPSIDTSSV
jgi:hypothetical protein